MEQKKLNLNAPLLSVRRFTSPLKDRFTSPLKERFISPLKERFTSPRKDRFTSPVKDPKAGKSSPIKKQQSIPSSRSELPQGEVTKPVAVPFQWEQIPGRAKGRGGLLCLCPQEQVPSFPKLPPGWTPDVVQQPLGKESDDQSVYTPRRNASSKNDCLTKSSCLKGRVKMEGDSELGCGGDDSYSDEHCTLSPDSCALSCRVSGLGSSDGPEMKPSGTFSLDPQTRDFMMERFLPAAKAMCLEVPHYASRKQSVASEQVSTVEEETHCGQKSCLDRYGSPYCGDVGKELHEAEDEDCGKTSDRSVGNCELMPELSSKGSLCLSHLAQGMEESKHFPKPVDIINKNINKHAWIIHHKRDREMKLLEPGDLDHKQFGTRSGQLNYSRVKLLEPDELQLMQTGARSGQLNYCRTSFETDGSSFSRRSSSRDGGISPYRNFAPRSSFHGGGFLGVPKIVKNFKVDSPSNEGSKNFEEALSCQRNRSRSSSGSPTVEKTVYIDSVNVTKAPRSLSSSDTNVQFVSLDDNLKALEESQGKKVTSTVETYIQETKPVNTKGRGIPKHKGTGHIDASYLRGQLSTMEGKQHSGLQQKPVSFNSIKPPADGSPGISNELGAEDAKKPVVSSTLSALQPPLPKSPSDSWLGRTLPSIASKNSHSYIRGQSPLRKDRSQSPLRKETPVTPLTPGPKWETIVKTSKSHHDHVRYSQELINHDSQQSRT